MENLRNKKDTKNIISFRGQKDIGSFKMIEMSMLSLLYAVRNNVFVNEYCDCGLVSNNALISKH